MPSCYRTAGGADGPTARGSLGTTTTLHAVVNVKTMP
jgi:hypothetical protein